MREYPKIWIAGLHFFARALHFVFTVAFNRRQSWGSLGTCPRYKRWGTHYQTQSKKGTLECSILCEIELILGLHMRGQSRWSSSSLYSKIIRRHIQSYNAVLSLTIYSSISSLLFFSSSDNYWLEKEHYDVMEDDQTFEFTVMRNPEGVKVAHTLGNVGRYSMIRLHYTTSPSEFIIMITVSLFFSSNRLLRQS